VGGFLLFEHPLGYNTEVYDAVEKATFNHYHESDRSQALFAHGIYDLSDYVDNLSFSAGYRYSWDYASLGETSTKPFSAVTRNADGLPTDCFLVLSDRNCFRSIDSHFNAPSWNVGLDDQLTPKTLVYIRAGNTYHPGGTNPLLRPPLDRYGSEHVTDVELGIKTDWAVADIRARTNADIFHADYKSIQVTQLVLVPNPNSDRAPSIQPILLNAASADLEGAEIEQTFNLPYGVDLSGQGAYFNAKYDQYPASLGGGTPGFQYVPRFAFGATATYHLPVDESWGKISAGLSWSWTGRQSVSPLANEPINAIPHYQDFDIRADWTDIFGRPLDAAFFMTNATDNLYLTGVIPLMTTLGISSGSYDPPRMYGFSLKYRFGPHS
jgi:iron complex outermembrane receptor protein